MGDPKKARKKYQTPMHPWEKERIDSEKELKRTYGVKNKREIMKMSSLLKNFKDQAKKYIAATGKQAEKEEQQLMTKLLRLGLLQKGSGLDDILGLDLQAIMERRLQTQVVKKGYANTVSQARQFITHRHITVNGQKITTPSYLVNTEEEQTIAYSPKSAFADDMHPERTTRKKEEKKDVGRAKKPAQKGRRPAKGGEKAPKAKSE